MIQERMSSVPGNTEWEQRLLADGRLCLLWKPAAARPKLEIFEAGKQMVAELRKWGVVAHMSHQRVDMLTLDPLMRAEEKMVLPIDNPMTAQDMTILACGPLIREGQGFLPFRVVLKSHGSKWATSTQIIPDGKGDGFAPSFNHGNYYNDYESAIDGWFTRIRAAYHQSK